MSSLLRRLGRLGTTDHAQEEEHCEPLPEGVEGEGGQKDRVDTPDGQKWHQDDEGDDEEDEEESCDAFHEFCSFYVLLMIYLRKFC